MYSISSNEAKIVVHCNFEKLFTDVSGQGYDTPFYMDLKPELSQINSTTIQVKFSFMAKMDQIKSLIDSSHSCFQTFRFDCKMAPLMAQTARWIDPSGNPQHFWHGNDPNDQRCQCGFEGSCPTMCNCNQKLPDWSIDTGIISAKSLLPVTAFQYGPLSDEMKKARVTFSSLKCSGLANNSRFRCDLQGICLVKLSTLNDKHTDFMLDHRDHP